MMQRATERKIRKVLERLPVWGLVPVADMLVEKHERMGCPRLNPRTARGQGIRNEVVGYLDALPHGERERIMKALRGLANVA